MFKFKISIRTNILTLFAVLMLTIGAIVVLIHYYTSSRLLFQSAENMLYLHSKNIEYEVDEFIQPARHLVNLATTLIQDGLIKLDLDSRFAIFMLANIVDLPRFSRVFFGDSKGNAIAVERSSDGTFNNEVIINADDSRHAMRTKLDATGQAIGKPVNHPTTFDPRVRPWYVKALKEKRLVLSDVYLFFPFGEKKSVLGLTIASPVYDKQRNLKGVFAIDLELRSLITS